MTRFVSHSLTVLSLLLCAATIAELAFSPTPEAIRAGTRFVYGSQVGLMARLPFAIVGMIGISVWLFTHRVWRPLTLLKWPAILLLTVTCLIFTIGMPLRSLARSAHHIQSLSIQQTHYRLYFQYNGLFSQQCQHVVVRCEAIGTQCHFIEEWDITPICLGSHAPIELRAADHQIHVIINGNIAAVFEEPS